MSPVTHADRERVAGAQIAAADPDEQRVGVGADVEPVEPDFQFGAVARLDRSEIRRSRFVELGLGEIRRGAPRDFHHPGIVDAESASGVNEHKLDVRAGNERPGRQELDRAHVLREILRIRHA